MNRKQLEYFVTALDCRNIQLAADRLYISHQGLSRVIRSLESELGQKLFCRTNRGIEPTEFAFAILPHVRTLLDTYTHIEGMQTLAGQNKAVVSIYALDHVLGFFGAEFVMEFNAAFPDVTLSVTDSTDEQAIRKLAAGECDFAIASGAVDCSNFNAEPLFYSRYCLRINKKNPLAAKADINPFDAAAQRLCGRGREYTCFRKSMDSLILSMNVPVDIPLETSDETVILQLVEKDFAVAVSYDFSAKDYCGENTVLRYFDDPKLGQNIYLISRSEYSAAAVGFKDFLLDRIKTDRSGKFTPPQI